MRTQRLAAWPPLAPEQVPSFPLEDFDYWFGLETRAFDESRRYWPAAPAAPASPRFGVYDPAHTIVSINGVPLRPLQRKAVEEARSASGFFVGVGR